MQIILLSGGSGTRLWPLSNESRSKQFLRILPRENSDELESMVQRIVRQIHEAGIDAPVTLAISGPQHDPVLSQLGNEVGIVIEPSRRNTFPAVSLACEYLAKEKGCQPDETVIVIPCDPFTVEEYFHTVSKMAEATANGVSDLLLMGIRPTYPSSKYDYIVPGKTLDASDIMSVEDFVTRPDSETAARLIDDQNALWNGGVFAFRLGFINSISRKYVDVSTYPEVVANFDRYPEESFDSRVSVNTPGKAVIPFDGYWKDLGTWNTLTDELKHHTYGNVTVDGSASGTYVINELDLPLMCIGTRDLIVAASPDGILVAEKRLSEKLKDYHDTLHRRPMYEERRWGSYKVIDSVEYEDGFCALTKQLTLRPGCSISYQVHACRDEVWTFINGEGEIVLNGARRKVSRGETVYIPKGMKHALRATTSLTFIEVQTGSNLVESDITRLPYQW